MLKSGLRHLLDRLAKHMDAKAESTFDGLCLVSAGEESARDEFITAHIVAREPATASRAARLSRLS